MGARYANRRPVARRRRYTTARIARFIYFIFGLINSLIAIRFVFRLLGARPANDFASLIYDVTYPFVAPFIGLFGREPSFNRSVVEYSSLVAIIVYALLAYMLVRLLDLFSD